MLIAISLNEGLQLLQEIMIKKTFRSMSKFYYFNKNDSRIRVCQKFFEKTLSISNGPVLKAFRDRSTQSGTFSGVDKRGKKSPGNKHDENTMLAVKNHIESFPVMEGHYVRKSSSRQYLDKNLSILKIYALYKDYCSENQTEPVGETSYRRFFCNNYNLSFYKPKKDQCPICVRYDLCKGKNEKDKLKPDYELHQQRKNDCYIAKDKD